MSTTRIGYVRLSRDDSKSLSIENQLAALKRFDPKMPVFIDKNVSGETNLTDPTTQWSKKVRPMFQRDPQNSQIVVFTLDRMSRKKGAMLFEAETMLDVGGTIHCVREDKTFDDADDASQAIELLFSAYQADATRVEGRKKTQVAIDALKAGKVPLGPPPRLTEAQIEQIHALRADGLGFRSIGRAVRTPRKNGDRPETSPRVIKRVVAGEYESREAWIQRGLEARERMAANALLRRQVSDEHLS